MYIFSLDIPPQNI